MRQQALLLAALLVAAVPAAGQTLPGRAIVVVASDNTGQTLTLALTADAPGPYAVLLAVPAATRNDPPRVIDAAPLRWLLGQTAPQLLGTSDADPCFAHPKAPTPTPIEPADPLAGPLTRPDTEVFSAPGPALTAWLAAHKASMSASAIATLARDGSAILAIGAPAGTGVAHLQPLQWHEKRPLGRLSALPQGADAMVIILAPQGRVLASPIASRPLPASVELPEFVRGQFAHFLDALTAHQTENSLAALVTFAGPAAAPALGAPQASFATRLRLRTDLGGDWPALSLHTTADTLPLRATYTSRIAWKGKYTLACAAGFTYRHVLTARWQEETATLANLTGWRDSDIRKALVSQWQATREPPG
jgi:hypothetical protein